MMIGDAIMPAVDEVMEALLATSAAAAPAETVVVSPPVVRSSILICGICSVCGGAGRLGCVMGSALAPKLLLIIIIRSYAPPYCELVALIADGWKFLLLSSIAFRATVGEILPLLFI